MRHPRRSLHQSRSPQSASSDSKIPHISVHIAASSSAKGTRYKPEKSTYDYDPSQTVPALGLETPEHNVFQKRRARPDSGQDAYFIAAVGNEAEQRSIAFGVCDGVGGWAEHGIDPADFSHGLCSYMARTALEWPQSEKLFSPHQLLELGYDKVVRDRSVKAGGSTACIGTVEASTGRMRIANLGDSGYLHLRLGAVHSYSNPQTHAFNTPYQLSLTPPEILAQAMIFGGLPLNDLPERADRTDHTVQHGDVIVLATDGVWDNLSHQDILTSVSNTMRTVGAWTRHPTQGFYATDKLAALVKKDMANGEGLTGTIQSVLAASIVGEAKGASMNRKRDGPFAKGWKLHHPYDPYHGGKVDDITALVLVSVEDGKVNGMESLKAKL